MSLLSYFLLYIKFIYIVNIFDKFTDLLQIQDQIYQNFYAKVD